MDQSQFFIKKIKKYDSVIASICIIIFVTVLIFLQLIPNFIYARSLIKDKSELEDRIELLNTKDKILSTLDENTLRTSLPKISRILPLSTDYVSLFSTFDYLQSKTGVAILRTDFQFGPVSTISARSKFTENSSHPIPLNFEVLGTVDQVRDFINSLADYSGRLITIDDTQIIVMEENLIQAQFKGQAYFYVLPHNLGQITSALPELNKSQELTLKKINDQQTIVTEEDDTVLLGITDLFGD